MVDIEAFFHYVIILIGGLQTCASFSPDCVYLKYNDEGFTKDSVYLTEFKNRDTVVESDCGEYIALKFEP